MVCGATNAVSMSGCGRGRSDEARVAGDVHGGHAAAASTTPPIASQACSIAVRVDGHAERRQLLDDGGEQQEGSASGALGSDELRRQVAQRRRRRDRPDTRCSRCRGDGGFDHDDRTDRRRSGKGSDHGDWKQLPPGDRVPLHHRGRHLERAPQWLGDHELLTVGDAQRGAVVADERPARAPASAATRSLDDHAAGQSVRAASAATISTRARPWREIHAPRHARHALQPA